MTIRARHGRSARDVLLTLGAVLGVVCILATTASAVFGVKPLVFRSGSMSPAISTGDLAIAREVDASQLERGDIVSVVNAAGSRVTHRLVASTERDGATQLVLKGDANKTADAEVYTATRAQKVLFDVPRAGYVVNAAASPGGVFVLGVFVASMVAVILRHPRDDRRGGPGSGDGRRRGGARRRASTTSRSVARCAVSVASIGVLAIASPAAAAWTDAVLVTGTSYSTHTVVPPASLVCSGGGLLSSLTYTWPNTDVRYQYVVTLENSSGTVVRTDVVDNTGSTSSNQSITYGFTLLNGFFGIPATLTVRVRPRLTATPSWTSSTTITATGKLVSIAFVGLASSCT